MAEILLMNDVISSSSSDNSLDSENSDTHDVFCTLQKEIRRRVREFLIFVKKRFVDRKRETSNYQNHVSLACPSKKHICFFFVFRFINLYTYHYLI
jgi:hypothetical protein